MVAGFPNAMVVARRESIDDHLQLEPVFQAVSKLQAGDWRCDPVVTGLTLLMRHPASAAAKLTGEVLVSGIRDTPSLASALNAAVRQASWLEPMEHHGLLEIAAQVEMVASAPPTRSSSMGRLQAPGVTVLSGRSGSRTSGSRLDRYPRPAYDGWRETGRMPIDASHPFTMPRRAMQHADTGDGEAAGYGGSNAARLGGNAAAWEARAASHSRTAATGLARGLVGMLSPDWVHDGLGFGERQGLAVDVPSLERGSVAGPLDAAGWGKGKSSEATTPRRTKPFQYLPRESAQVRPHACSNRDHHRRHRHAHRLTNIRRLYPPAQSNPNRGQAEAELWHVRNRRPDSAAPTLEVATRRAAWIADSMTRVHADQQGWRDEASACHSNSKASLDLQIPTSR